MMESKRSRSIPWCAGSAPVRPVVNALEGWLTAALVGALAGSLFPVPSRAQEASPSTVVIVVTDSLDGPLDLASALLSRAGRQGVSGRDGRIVLRNIPPGRDTLTIRRIGYSPLIVSLDLSPGDTLRLDAVLDPLALALNDIQVTARRGLRTFDRRMRNAIFSPPNSFLTPEWLDTFPPRMPVSEILQKAGIVYRRFGIQRRLACPPGRTGRTAPVVILLNGGYYPDREGSFLEYMARMEVKAIEVYRSKLEMPLDLPVAAGSCAVVVWTR